MENTKVAKNEILGLLYQIYGETVGDLFQNKYGEEVIPIFVQNSFSLLKQNVGKYKASDFLDKILSKYGISVSSYE